MGNYDINLREYFRILRRRKGIVILVPIFFGISAFTMAVLQTPKPVYQAKSVVRVERTVNMAGLLQEVFSFDPESNLETQAALIKGFPVMSLTAKKLGLIPEEATPDEIRASPAYLEAIDDLEGQVEVQRVKATSLIEIEVTSADPEDAVRIANTTAKAFQEDNLATRSRQVREARKFIEGQLQEVGAKLRQAEEGLGAFQEKSEIILLPDEIKAASQRLVTLEADLEKTKRAAAEAESELRRLKKGKASTRPIGLSSDPAGPALSKLYASLSDLTLGRENLLLTLYPDHPKVRHLDGKIANLRQSLRKALTSRLQALRGRLAELRNKIARQKQQQAALPEAALEMARSEREVKVNERIYALLKEKYQEALIKEKEQVAEVSLVRPATVASAPVNGPAAVPKAAVGLVIGLIMGGVLAFVVESMDTSIGAIDEVESLLETSVLGVIPHLDVEAELAEEKEGTLSLDKESREKYTLLLGLFLPKSRVVEAFRALRTNLFFSGLERDLKTLMVTSSTQMEGKTTVAINLAIALAQLGKRTLLVEGDLRNPFLHHAFGIAKEPGVAEVVIGSVPLEKAVRSFPDLVLGRAGIEGVIDRPGIDNLFLLTSGHQPPNPTEFLSAKGMTDFLAGIREQYDCVIFDAAPILPVADSSILGSHVDGTLMTVRVGRVARAALRRAKALLEGSRTRVLGVCLTGVRAEVSPDYAEMAYYRYRYG
ncbi:MAG: GumC family protein, partial [Candidatus Methylomirabilales bacterium]